MPIVKVSTVLLRYVPPSANGLARDRCAFGAQRGISAEDAMAAAKAVLVGGPLDDESASRLSALDRLNMQSNVGPRAV